MSLPPNSPKSVQVTRNLLLLGVVVLALGVVTVAAWPYSPFLDGLPARAADQPPYTLQESLAARNSLVGAFTYQPNRSESFRTALAMAVTATKQQYPHCEVYVSTEVLDPGQQTKATILTFCPSSHNWAM